LIFETDLVDRPKTREATSEEETALFFLVVVPAFRRIFPSFFFCCGDRFFYSLSGVGGRGFGGEGVH
jgi:hypothetical protein